MNDLDMKMNFRYIIISIPYLILGVLSTKLPNLSHSQRKKYFNEYYKASAVIAGSRSHQDILAAPQDYMQVRIN